MGSSSPSVLIVRLDAVGDALVTVPLVAALHGAGCNLGAVLSRRNADAFAPGILSRVHVVPDTSASQIADAHYDVALIPSEEPEAYELARDAGVRERIGFWHGLRAKPFKSLWIRRQCTRVVYRPAGLDTHGRHESEVVFDLGRALLQGAPIPRDAHALRRFVTDAAGTVEGATFQVTDKWLRLGASLGDVVQAARKCTRETAIRYIGALAEDAFIARFESEAGVAVERFERLDPWKRAIAQSRALIAPDSGAVHVAGMTGTPVVALYAAEQFALQVSRWRPWAAPFRAIALEDGWTEHVDGALRALLSESTGV